MRKITFVLSALFLSTLLGGCASASFMNRGVPFAGLYAEESGPMMVTDNSIGSKSGEACSSSILGWVVTGDSSIKAAAQDGGIKRIGAVDNKYTNILGIIATYCTVVSGE